MNFEKLREYGILLVIGIIGAVGAYQVFSSHSNLEKGISLKTNIGISISKGVGELGKYNKNIVSYLSKSDVLNKTYGKYQIKLLTSGTRKLIPMFIGGVGDKQGETLLIRDSRINNILTIDGVGTTESSLANDVVFNETAGKNVLFPFLVTRGTHFTNQCYTDLSGQSSINGGSTLLVGLYANDNRSSTEAGTCKFETQSGLETSGSNCETSCDRGQISPDLFGYVTDGYYGLGYFKSFEEADLFNKEFFGSNGVVVHIEGTNGKTYFGLLQKIGI